MPDQNTNTSPEEITRCYNEMLRSVNLITSLSSSPPSGMSRNDVVKTISRQRQHLVVNRQKPFWTTEDMTAIDATIASST